MDNLEKDNKNLSLLVLTHIDSDHISGILKLFEYKAFNFSRVNQMWFNYGDFLYKELQINKNLNNDGIKLLDNQCNISWNQGNLLESLLRKKAFQYEHIIKVKDEFIVDGALIKILSPSIEILTEFNKHWEIEKEKVSKISAYSDYNDSIEYLNNLEFNENISLANKSSLAFIFEFNGFKALLLGDASATEIEKALIEMGYSDELQLSVDICKISHHASKNNTSTSLIKKIRCNNYIISTIQTTSGRPSKECLSRIIVNSEHPINFFCNYEIDFNTIFTQKELIKYKINFIKIEKEGINFKDLNNE
jgi:hypothetical protein